MLSLVVFTYLSPLLPIWDYPSYQEITSYLWTITTVICISYLSGPTIVKHNKTFQNDALGKSEPALGALSGIISACGA